MSVHGVLYRGIAVRQRHEPIHGSGVLGQEGQIEALDEQEARDLELACFSIDRARARRRQTGSGIDRRTPGCSTSEVRQSRQRAERPCLFQTTPSGHRIWVPGRKYTSPTTHVEGGFLLDVPDFTPDDLAVAQTELVLGHTPGDCTSEYSFDRNYAAMNAVVPGAAPGTLLGFYDAEFHVNCPDGRPLLSSIGLAISMDGGVTWTDRQQVIKGHD